MEDTGKQSDEESVSDNEINMPASDDDISGGTQEQRLPMVMIMENRGNALAGSSFFFAC